MPSDPAPAYTPFLHLPKPPDNADNWGGDYRAAMDAIDSFATTVTPAGNTSVKVEQQRYFIITSGVLRLNTQGFFRGLFINPAGSDRTMRLVRMAAFASHGPAYVEVYKNPTSGLPTTDPRPVTNAHLGAVFNSMAELRVDVTTGVEAVRLGGGIDTGWVFPLPGGQPVSLDLPPLVIPAGTRIGINIPFMGAADATMSLFFLEE